MERQAHFFSFLNMVFLAHIKTLLMQLSFSKKVLGISLVALLYAEDQEKLQNQSYNYFYNAGIFSQYSYTILDLKFQFSTAAKIIYCYQSVDLWVCRLSDTLIMIFINLHGSIFMFLQKPLAIFCYYNMQQ